ncbi:MAG TPA: hypothetical protein PK263_05615, partial [bacterium]|nr:hypothetical protein [bacterium]
AIVDWGLSKLFAWTDHALGLPTGSSLRIFKAGVNLYKAWKAYKAAKAVNDVAQMAQASDKMNAAKMDLIKIGIDIAVHKYLGKTISKWEDDLGMIPGTLEQLVSALIFSAFFGGPGLGIAIVIAVFGYLMGAKYYYYCTPDGYYPEMGLPNYEENDISDVGEFGGRISIIEGRQALLNRIIEEGSIKSAQYKANRLIGDMLMMQYNSKYNDFAGQPVIPVQIMTGREEDVESWNAMITSNMCQARLGAGAVSFGGVCGFPNRKGLPDPASDIRLGVWANPQTVGWTHIGY